MGILQLCSNEVNMLMSQGVEALALAKADSINVRYLSNIMNGKASSKLTVQGVTGLNLPTTQAYAWTQVLDPLQLQCSM